MDVFPGGIFPVSGRGVAANIHVAGGLKVARCFPGSNCRCVYIVPGGNLFPASSPDRATPNVCAGAAHSSVAFQQNPLTAGNRRRPNARLRRRGFKRGGSERLSDVRRAEVSRA